MKILRSSKLLAGLDCNSIYVQFIHLYVGRVDSGLYKAFETGERQREDILKIEF